MPITTCIFDAYGTLYDVNAAARRAAEEAGRDDLAALWPKLAADWRAKQLQYTWLRAITGDHTSFWEVTKDGLDWALEAHGLDNDPVLRETLLALYWELPAHKDAPRMLATLKAKGFTNAILSNGSPEMLEGARDFSGIGEWLDATLSVEEVAVFKPARAVYDMVGGRFGTTPDQVLFVTANGWDAAGAAAYGFHTAWINRTGDPVDRMPARPGHILTDLTPIPDLASTL